MWLNPRSSFLGRCTHYLWRRTTVQNKLIFWLSVRNWASPFKKRFSARNWKPLILVARPEWFEPPTYGFEGRFRPRFRLQKKARIDSIKTKTGKIPPAHKIKKILKNHLHKGNRKTKRNMENRNPSPTWKSDNQNNSYL